MASNKKVGLFFLGGLGTTSSLSIFLISLLKCELINKKNNFITSLEGFKGLNFLSADNIEQIGGIDIRKVSLYENLLNISARDNLNINNLLENEKVKHILNMWNKNYSIGISQKDVKSNGKEIDTVKNLISDFYHKNKLDRVIVIYLSSAEEHINLLDKLSLEDLKKIIRTNSRILPANIIYTYATIDSGVPFINFTSCQANSIPAIIELAKVKKVAHCGRDGKTGETYMKSILAPAFKLRNFPILFWESHNILGDGDGLTLQNEKLRRDKLKDKALSVKSFMNGVEHNVRIDYVKALGDWKTAWDLIEWEGPLNSRMSVQFIWKGHDGLLAAPMIWDLIRFVDLAVNNGDYGVQKHLSFFFKNPIDYHNHNAFIQFELLKNSVTKKQ